MSAVNVKPTCLFNSSIISFSFGVKMTKHKKGARSIISPTQVTHCLNVACENDHYFIVYIKSIQFFRFLSPFFSSLKNDVLCQIIQDS